MDATQLRKIPKMDQLLAAPALQGAIAALPRAMARNILQQELDDLRQGLLSGSLTELPPYSVLEQQLAGRLHAAAPFHLRPLINATGVVLHTNLGRAPLGEALSRHVAEVAAGYSNLEYRLEEGRRGSRFDHVEELLCRITGAEAALVVNNNASAVFLMLNTLAAGTSVAVSRGELVEIGGAFRVPEIMAQSGASLLEIGTTNKTRLSDYVNALDAGAGAILKVHTSNFKLIGFTEEATVEELAPLAEGSEVPLLYDVGSGFLVHPQGLGIYEGVYIPQLVPLCDVLCFSGDKLLGGPQAGILLGRKSMIAAMKKNHLSRMLRIDKLTLAALEAVLRWYLDEKQAVANIPTLSMLHAGQAELLERAQCLAAQLQPLCPKLTFIAEPCMDQPGGGSLPGVDLPGAAVAVGGMHPDVLEKRLRLGNPPVIGRISQNRYLLSLRTLMENDIPGLLAAFAALEAEA